MSSLLVKQCSKINIKNFSTSLVRGSGGQVPPGGTIKNKTSPNLLVYGVQKNEFSLIRSSLLSILEPNTYVIYHLSSEDFKKEFWISETRVLILTQHPRDESEIRPIMNYAKIKGSKILHYKINPLFSNQKYSSATYDGKNSLSAILKNELGLTLAHSSSTPRDLGHKLIGSLESKTPSLLNEFIQFYNSDSISLNKTLVFVDESSKDCYSSDDSIIWISNHKNDSCTFNTTKYFELLKTKDLGHLVLHSPVLNSTFDPLKNSKLFHGFLVVADRQIAGKGRGRNEWISPFGCAMFSLQLHIPIHSYLGRHLSLIQIIIALATVHAISIHYPHLNLRLKWPNDIYYGESIKMGGVLVESSIFQKLAVINIGVGFNLSSTNSGGDFTDFTTLDELCKMFQWTYLSRESLLSSFLNVLEDFLNDSQRKESFRSSILPLYYKYWLHSNQIIHFTSDKYDGVGDESSSTFFEGIIRGIDSYGFLVVQRENDVISLHPDGNSFDMMKGLLFPKR